MDGGGGGTILKKKLSLFITATPRKKPVLGSERDCKISLLPPHPRALPETL